MTARQQTLCFRGLVLGLLTAVAWIGSDLVLARVEAALDSRDETTRSFEPRPVESSGPALDVSVIARRNIFNSAAPPEAAMPNPVAAGEESATDVVPASSLNLVLRGTWIVDRKKDGGAWAIVEDPVGKTQAIYRVGDALPGGDAVVAEILPRAIQVRRGGQLELLSFPENWEAPTGEAGLQVNNASTLGGGADEIRQIAPGRYEIGKRLVDHNLADLNNVLTQARAIPVKDEGFRIRSIKKGSIFEKIGLQNGDLLRSVNGIQLKSFEEAMRAYKMLRTETRLRLDILRGSTQQSLDYEIR